MRTVADRYAEYRRRLNAFGQAHLLAFWPQLSEAQRVELLSDLDQVDFERCQALIETHVQRRPRVAFPQRLEPPEIFPARPDPSRVELYERAQLAGRDAIGAGRVAAFTVAGGQGTRLGFDGPKGAFPISPIRGAPLFQWFAESLRGVERRYGFRPPWYIMTSPANHAATIAFFESHGFFGLSAADVRFFPQRQMPAFLPDGRIALSAPHRLALAPDGHGGSLRALAENGALEDLRQRGSEYISYFQVDNPLVRTIDPLFIGLHILTEAEISSKAAQKANDLERVGNFCLADGRLTVIEYSDLPEDLARTRNPDGSRKFDAGSIAVHVLSRPFVERLTAPGATVALPWHRADKKVAYVAADGRLVTSAASNAVKLEMFVFDAIPLAKRALVQYTPREEEFSPLKNADGVDSPATARRDMLRRTARWLESCGVTIARDAMGEPAVALEISPACALDAEDLRERWRAVPAVVRGQAWLWA